MFGCGRNSSWQAGELRMHAHFLWEKLELFACEELSTLASIASTSTVMELSLMTSIMILSGSGMSAKHPISWKPAA